MRTRVLPLIAGILVACVLGAGVVEIAVRTWAPQQLTPGIFAFDGPICHRLKPNMNGVQLSGEYRVNLNISAQGFRDRFYPLTKPAGTFRVLALGDSHTFGWGVELADTYTKVLERALNRRSTGPIYEVINGGTVEYGTGHQMQLLTHYGYALDPDLVLVMMNPLHDIRLNNREFSVRDGVLRRNAATCRPASSRDRTQLVPVVGWLRERSHALALLNRPLRRQRRERDAAREADAYELDNTRQIFTLMKHDLDRRGIGLSVVFLPLAPLRSSRRADADSVRPNVERRALEELQEFFTVMQVPYYSFNDTVARESNPDGLSFQQARYYNANGHAYLAGGIERFLVEFGALHRDTGQEEQPN